MEWRTFPPLAALRAFAAFTETGNVQDAGAALNVSHAAISQQLRSLEDHLGVSLLDRSGRALVLTTDGKLLADALQEGFSTIEGTIRQLTGAEDARPLHVSTTTSFAASWLMPRLSGFRAAHPGIDLIIAPSSERQDPTPGGVDLAIRYGPGDWPGVEVEPFLKAPIIGVASPALVGSNPSRDPKVLAEYAWLHELGSHEASDWLQKHGVALQGPGGVLRAPGNLMLDAARAGQGIAITTTIAAADDLASGRLVQLFTHDENRAYFLVTRPGVQRPALRKFVSWLRKEAASASASAIPVT